MVDVKISLLSDRAKIPTRMTDSSAGYDLYAAVDAVYSRSHHLFEWNRGHRQMSCPNRARH